MTRNKRISASGPTPGPKVIRRGGFFSVLALAIGISAAIHLAILIAFDAPASAKPPTRPKIAPAEELTASQALSGFANIDAKRAQAENRIAGFSQDMARTLQKQIAQFNQIISPEHWSPNGNFGLAGSLDAHRPATRPRKFRQKPAPKAKIAQQPAPKNTIRKQTRPAKPQPAKTPPSSERPIKSPAPVKSKSKAKTKTKTKAKNSKSHSQTKETTKAIAVKNPAPQAHSQPQTQSKSKSKTNSADPGLPEPEPAKKPTQNQPASTPKPQGASKSTNARAPATKLPGAPKMSASEIKRLGTATRSAIQKALRAPRGVKNLKAVIEIQYVRGSFSTVRLIKSSGNARFDASVMNAAARARYPKSEHASTLSFRLAINI